MLLDLIPIIFHYHLGCSNIYSSDSTQNIHELAVFLRNSFKQEVQVTCCT